MALAFLIASSTLAKGDYTPPSQSGSLLGEVWAFVGDFSDRNAGHNILAIQFLEKAPEGNQASALLVLLWLRLNDRATMLSGGNSSSSLSISAILDILFSSTASKNPRNLPIGSIVLDQSGHASAPSLWNENRQDPPGIRRHFGSILGLNDSPFQSGAGAKNGLRLENDPPSQSFINASSPTPLIDAVPEPASFTLLAVGCIGLLIGRRMRFGKTVNAACRRPVCVP